MDGKTKDSWAILPTNDMHGRYRPIPVIKVTVTSRTEDAGPTWDEIDRVGPAGGFPALATAVRRIRWYWCLSLLALLATGCATSCREKVVEHPIPRLYGTEDSQFSRTMGTLLGMGILGGNQVDELLNGDEIFPAMLQAIRGAKTTVTFETYIYWSGSIGSDFSNALAERARAGVKVHVLLDWIGSGKMDAAQLVLMEQAGVQVRKYHKPHWYQLGRLNNRTHRKLLVVDGQTGFTGGLESQM